MNAQEIRNVIFRSKLNDLIIEMSAHPFLRSQLKIKDQRSQAYRAMQDVEYVLRFLTLRETWMQFSGDFRTAMDEFMMLRIGAGPRDLREYSTAFNSSIDACRTIWGPLAFRRFERGQWRDQMLGGMFDAQMIAVDFFNESDQAKLATRSGAVISATQDLFNDPSFETAVRTSTNTPSRLYHRVDRMISTLSGVLA